MPRAASGAITITDVTDGTNPISAFLSNENHTFPSSNSGSVGATDRAVFASTPTVFIGTTTASYVNQIPTANDTFTISDGTGFGGTEIVSSSAGWTVSANTSTGAITVTAIPVGTTGANLSTILTIPLLVRNSGTNISVSLTVSLSKSIEGTGGAIVQLSPNKQFFSFDAAGAESPTAQTDVTIGVESQGITGTLALQHSINGGAFANTVVGDPTATNVTAGTVRSFEVDGGAQTQLNGAITAGNTTSITVDSTVGFTAPGSVTIEDDTFNFTTVTNATTLTGASQALAAHADDTLVESTGANDSIVIAFENFNGKGTGIPGTAVQTVTYRVRGATGGSDSTSLVRVSEGAAGAAAIIVDLSSSAGTTFKTTDGSAAMKTITVTVYDAATGNPIDPTVTSNVDITYSWTVQNAAGVSSVLRTTSDATRTVVDTGGEEQTGKVISGSSSSAFNTIIVDGDDVDTRAQYSCLVSVADA